MKSFCLLIIRLLFIIDIAFSASWQLIWSDEFDTEGLPGTAKWTYEEGFVRNEESQYYTRGRSENARISSGCLIIEGRKERITNPFYRPGDESWRLNREYAEYTSASLTTRGKFSFLYGRAEIRAKLPAGKGNWPAFWTLGADWPEVRWPYCGEIDIMEYVGLYPNRILSALHYSLEGKHNSQEKSIRTPSPYKDFHVYAMEWYPEHIDFFFDNTLYFTFPLDSAGIGGGNPFRKPQFLIINLALGGGAGGIIDDSIFPQRFVIDYVRVYKKQ